MLLPSVCSLSEALRGYKNKGIKFKNIIDGGAGTGDTAKWFSQYAEGKVFAFEPNPGNWPYIKNKNMDCANVMLVGKALGKENGKGILSLPWSAPDNYVWDGETRQKGGWSHSGFLVDASSMQSDKGQFVEIEIIRGDDAVLAAGDVTAEINFMKLDLQGNELSALQGMTRILNELFFLYVEYTGQPGLLEFLVQNGFLCFEQTYVFNCEPAKLPAGFTYLGQGILSTGNTITNARHDGVWSENPYEEFSSLKKNNGFIWTDLLCVPVRRLSIFEQAIDVNLLSPDRTQVYNAMNDLIAQKNQLDAKIDTLNATSQKMASMDNITGAVTQTLIKELEKQSLQKHELISRIESIIPFPKAIWNAIPEDRKILFIKNSGIADEKAYLDLYPDVLASGLDPILHYVRHGMLEGREMPMKT